MNYLSDKVRSAMGADGGRWSPFNWLLQLISYGYAAGLICRRMVYRTRLLKTNKLPCRVVSVGNITVGGTGKTPMTIYVARLVQELGYKAAVISRGYKGGAEKNGGIVGDGQSIRMRPETAGDEPYLLAENLEGIPVLVGRNRFASGMTAIRDFGAQVVILDDAFQHIQLKRDIDLVLVDDRRPFGNYHLLPRGTLREPIDALMRCDAVILTRCTQEKTATAENLKNMMPRQAVFRSRHMPMIEGVFGPGENAGPTSLQAVGPEGLGRQRVFAFSGLADNRNFKDSLTEMACQLVGSIGFPDHHHYSDGDLDGILRSARESGADVLATTAKDFTKISSRIKGPMKLVVIGVEVSFGEEEAAFQEFIQNRLNSFAGGNSPLLA